MKRIMALLVPLFLLLSLSICTASTVRAAASSTFKSVPNGNAYAAYVIVPHGTGTITYGPSVPVSLSCTAPPPASPLTNSGPAVPLGPLAGGGTAQSMITVTRTSSSDTVRVSEDIKGLSILAGLIQADEVHALVTSTATPTGATSTSTSSFSRLTVAGLPVNNNPAPNTTLNLPGLGSIILNEQSGPTNGANTTSIGVVMMDIRISLLNGLGFPVGSRIIIGFANSASLPSAVGASAYGLYAQGLGGSTPSIGPLAAAGISCSGGSSTVTANAISEPNVGNVGSETSSASGQTTPTSANAKSSNSTSALNLLSGLIQASQVTTTANAAWNGTGTSSGSTVFQNGTVNGVPLASNPAPNTRINLSGLGFVIVNEQSGSSNASGASEAVIGLDINITVTNSLGLPVGARIIVSRSYAAAASY